MEVNPFIYLPIPQERWIIISINTNGRRRHEMEDFKHWKITCTDNRTAIETASKTATETAIATVEKQ